MSNYLVKFVCGREKPFTTTLERIRTTEELDLVCNETEKTWGEFLEFAECGDEFFTDNFIYIKL
jgi:hypothetical protein